MVTDGTGRNSIRQEFERQIGADVFDGLLPSQIRMHAARESLARFSFLLFWGGTAVRIVVCVGLLWTDGRLSAGYFGFRHNAKFDTTKIWRGDANGLYGSRTCLPFRQIISRGQGKGKFLRGSVELNAFALWCLFLKSLQKKDFVWCCISCWRWRWELGWCHNFLLVHSVYRLLFTLRFGSSCRHCYNRERAI